MSLRRGKGNMVTAVFSPEEAGTIDDHLHRMGDVLPLPLTITNIRAAPNNFAGATVQTTGSYHQYTPPGPIVLVHQNGSSAISRRCSSMTSPHRRPHQALTST